MPESEHFHHFLRTEFSNLTVKLNTLIHNFEITTENLETINNNLKNINNNLTKLVALQSNKPCMNSTSSINNLVEELAENK